METQKLIEDFPVLSLGAFMFAAGVSKFFIIEYWTGYEPELILQLTGLAADQLLLMGGVFETALGIALMTGRRTRELSLMTSIYLAAITLQVASLGFYALAIRDAGLALFALSVYMINRSN